MLIYIIIIKMTFGQIKCKYMYLRETNKCYCRLKLKFLSTVRRSHLPVLRRNILLLDNGIDTVCPKLGRGEVIF